MKSIYLCTYSVSLQEVYKERGIDWVIFLCCLGRFCQVWGILLYDLFVTIILAVLSLHCGGQAFSSCRAGGSGV